MTVAAQVPFTVATGTGSATTFPTNFRCDSEDDAVAIIDGVTQAGSAFSVTGLGGSTCSFVFVTAPASGARVVMMRQSELKRDTDYQYVGDFRREVVNPDFDRLWLAMQEFQSGTQEQPNALRLPAGETIDPLPALDTLKGKLLAVDGTGKPVGIVGAEPDSAAALDLALRSTAVLAEGDAQIGVKRNLSGSTATTLHDRIEGDVVKVYDFLTDAQRADVRAGTLANNLTTAYQAALSAAYAAGIASVEVMDGISRIDGTLSIPSGVTLYAHGNASEYYFGSPYGTIAGAKLYKPNATGTAGPIIELSTGSAIRGLYLHHDKLNGASTGIVRMGAVGTSNVCYSARVQDCRLYGHLTTDITGTNTCFGIYFPDSDLATSKQRYFNKITGNFITNCDIAWRLGAQSNSNLFTGNITRQCYVHSQLDGGDSECVDNVVSGNVHMNIGALPTTATTVFRLLNSCKFNAFIGYTTECNGKAFDISAGSLYNSFDGLENEPTPSYVPAGNTHAKWAQPINPWQASQMLLPNSTSGTRYEQGQGNKVSFFQLVSGTLPQLNAAGSMAAADANCKKIVTFPASVYTKANRPSFYCELTLFVAAAGGGAGEHITRVRFLYRVTDQSTNAASLSVLSVDRKAATNYAAGLYFLTGVAAGSGFGIAMVGGNVGAVLASHVAVQLDITALTHTTNTVAMADYAALTFASTAATAGDVTDAITLLTVADTAV